MTVVSQDTYIYIYIHTYIYNTFIYIHTPNETVNMMIHLYLYDLRVYNFFFGGGFRGEIPTPKHTHQKTLENSHFEPKNWRFGRWFSRVIFGSQPIIFKGVPSGQLTWQWKIPILCRKYIFQWSISYCYVRLPECIPLGKPIDFSISRWKNQTPPRPFSTAVAQASNGVASGMAWVQKSSITAPTKPHCSKLIELFFSEKKKLKTNMWDDRVG